MSSPKTSKRMLSGLSFLGVEFEANKILQQPELLMEEQETFPCPVCGKELDNHTDEEIKCCMFS
jgi:DNA repair exonuclease SbcCD ATPase subunit